MPGLIAVNQPWVAVVQDLKPNFEIVKIRYEQIQDIYPKLYEEIFHGMENQHIPHFVYVGFKNNEYVGFVSGISNRKDHVEIHYAGYTDKFKGFQAPNNFKEVLRFIHKEYEYCTIRISNENVPALKVAMKAGFRIFGIRLVDTYVWVELLSKKSTNISI